MDIWIFKTGHCKNNVDKFSLIIYLFWYFAEIFGIMGDKEKKDKTIHISEETHEEARKITKEKGYSFGKYCDKAIQEKNQKEKLSIKTK